MLLIQTTFHVNISFCSQGLGSFYKAPEYSSDDLGLVIVEVLVSGNTIRRSPFGVDKHDSLIYCRCERFVGMSF